ncbi:MAG TPA: universal stress protein [Anaerolineae bacterium]|nr:universal stress protein [Anaerolineae bacterium]
MGKILCATRGGEESAETQAGAIALARERGDELVFLYVADASFLNRIAAALVVDVEGELDRMGRFQLAMACEQAAAQGVDAHAVLRHGRLQEELPAVARELNVTLVVLGRPRAGVPVFGDDAALRAFVARLQEQTGAEVRVL